MRVGVIKVCGDKMLRRIISFAQSKLLLQATSSKGLPMASRYFFSGSAPCPNHLLHNLDLIHIINIESVFSSLNINPFPEPRLWPAPFSNNTYASANCHVRPIHDHHHHHHCYCHHKYRCPHCHHHRHLCCNTYTSNN